jgi:WD40 repeat protein
MTMPPDHPSVARLRAFVEGRVEGPELADIESHLETCPACCRLLEAVPDEDNLVSQLRLAAASRSADTPRPAGALRPHAAPAVPGYEILGELGRGGMGVVYRARQVGLNRLVALKVLLGGGHASPEEQVRFHTEAEAIARLRHPNIVQVYETGAHEGAQYFALEYVEGGSLADHLRGRPLPPRTAAGLIEVLARAVHAAHRQGVIHRDLKPANVLLAVSRDPKGSASEGVLPFGSRLTDAVPKITDFGLAKCLDSDSQLTRTGSVAGTPGYMAPEQAWGPSREVGPAADVYGLGATLYDLLTGRPPFQGPTALETLQQLRDDEPAPPRRLQPRVPRDLETICLKCLNKEPRRRYAAADALAEDLARFLKGESIRARPAGPLRRVGKWVLRRPAVAGLLVLVMFLAGAGLGGVLAALGYAFAGWDRAARQERAAVQAGADARTARNAAQRQSAGLLFERGLQLAEQKDAGEGLIWMAEALKQTPDETDADRAFSRMVRVNLAAWGRLLPRPLAVLDAADISCAAVSPDGNIVATGDHDGRIHLWEAATGRPRGAPLAYTHSVASLAFSPDGRILLAGYGPVRGTSQCAGVALRWDLEAGRVVGEPLRHPAAETLPVWLKTVNPVAWSPDGRLILTGQDQFVYVWDAATGRPAGAPWDLGVEKQELAFAPDGRSVLVETGKCWATHEGWVGQGDVQLWDLERGKRLGVPFTAPPKHALQSLAWSGDGTRILAGSNTTETWLLRWRPAERETTGEPLLLPGCYPRLTPDGRTALVRDRDSDAVRLWDLGSCRPAPARLAPSWAGMTTIGPDGETLVRGSEVWRLPRPLSRPGPSVPGAVPLPGGPPAAGQEARAVFTPDGKAVVVRHSGDLLQCWDAAGRPTGIPIQSATGTLALSSDGARLAAQVSYGTTSASGARMWDLASGRPITAVLQHPDQVRPLAFDPTGRRLAVGTYGGKVYLYDAADGRQLAEPLQQNDIVMSLAFSPDGKLLAAGTAFDWNHAPQTRFWDPETRQLVGEPMPSDGRVERVLFRPDGRAVLACSPQTARLWEVPTGKPLSAPITLGGYVEGIAFSPRGGAFATNGPENTVRIWDGSSGAPLGPPLKGPARPTDAAFSPDGSLLVVGCVDGSARLWDVATSQPLGPPVVQGSGILAVAWAADGRQFLTVSSDGRPRAWPVPEPLDADAEQIAAALELATTLQLDAGRAVSPLDRDAWLARRREWLEGRRSLDGVLGAPLSDAAWHEAQARDAEEDGEPFAARWHLDRLLAVAPDDWLLWARRAASHSTEGRFDLAAADYQRAEQAAPQGALRAWYEYREAACRLAGRAEAAAWYRQQLGPG